jgi:hypothetical protein
MIMQRGADRANGVMTGGDSNYRARRTQGGTQ